ncbi:hypothetical protein BDK51DRAFT_13140, partial [Blyttiomyces helicus]
IVTCPQPNVWGITYDDGPIVSTPANVSDTVDIRNHLDALGIKATFFIVGSNAIQNPAIINASLMGGHEIGVHTWTHHPMTSLTNQQIVAEIKYTEAQIYNATGVVPNLFRPPYGDIDDRVRAII